MTTRLTMLLRMLGVALLAMLLLATPAMAQDDDDDDDDGHQHATETVTGSDDDDDHDDGQATGTGTAAAGSDDDRFGTFMRAGACEAPGDVVEEIGQLDEDDDDVWSVIGGDDPAPEIVFDEDEDIGQTIDELAGGEFVVTVHEGGSADSAVISCGAIAGTVDSDGTLLIDLDEIDDSGFQGRAHFAPDDDDADDDTDGDTDDADDDDDDGDQTEVTVGLWEVTTPGGV